MNTKRFYFLSVAIAVALFALLVLTRSRAPEPQESNLQPQPVMADSDTEPVEEGNDMDDGNSTGTVPGRSRCPETSVRVSEPEK